MAIDNPFPSQDNHSYLICVGRRLVIAFGLVSLQVTSLAWPT